MINAQLETSSIQQKEGRHRLTAWFPNGAANAYIFLRSTPYSYGDLNPSVPILEYGLQDPNRIYIVTSGRNPPGLYNLEIWQNGVNEIATNKLTVLSDGYDYKPRPYHQRQIDEKGEVMPLAKIAFDYDSVALPNVKQFDVYEVDKVTNSRLGAKVGSTTTVPTDLTPLSLTVSKFGSVLIEVVPVDLGGNEGFTDFLTLLVRLPKPTRIRAIG
jgi:hypothetical protein